MKSIIVSKIDNDSLLSQLGSLYNTFKGVDFGEKLEFDLSSLKWANPLLILPISAYIDATQSQFKMANCDIESYLGTIGFPKGVDSVSSFERQIQKYKTYIPISILKRKDKVGREKLETLFEEKIYKTLGNISGARSAVWYPISELITNIFEHSKKDSGFVFAQYYPKKYYLDICIADYGRGFAKTYEEEKGLKLSDADAIAEAMKGNSVKKDKERGYGIRTSKDVICKALKGGSFILISGSSALVSIGTEEKLVSLPNFYWQGAIIAYRIPKPTGNIDYLKYVE